MDGWEPPPAMMQTLSPVSLSSEPSPSPDVSRLLAAGVMLRRLETAACHRLEHVNLS